MKFVDKECVQPSRESAEFEHWKQQDGYVRSCLNATLHQSVAHLAIGTTTALALWHKLETAYLQQAYARKTHLRNQLQTVKQANLSVESYCDTVHKIANSLDSIGESVSDSDLVLYVLNGLNPEFHSIITNVEYADKQPNFIELRSKLLMYEQRLISERQTPSEIHTSAMTAHTLSASEKYIPPHLNFSQNNRGSMNGGRSRGRSRGRGEICQICSKQGHSAARCYFRLTPVTGTIGRGSLSPFTGRECGRNNILGAVAHQQAIVSFTHSTGYSDPMIATGSTNGFATYQSKRSPGPSDCFADLQSHTPQHWAQSVHAPALHSEPGFRPDHFKNWTSTKTQSEFTPHTLHNNHFGCFADISDVCNSVDSWLPDSGATAHMTSDPSLVHGATVYTGSENVIVGNGFGWKNSPPHSA